MKIAFIVTGLPNENNPSRSKFNQVHIDSLSYNGHEIIIFYLRSINPLRKLIKRDKKKQCKIIECSFLMPYISKSIKFFILKKLVNLFIDKEDIDVIQGIGGDTSVMCHTISQINNKPYTLHFIGNDINIDAPKLVGNNIYYDSIEKCKYFTFESKELENKFGKIFKGNNKKTLYRGIDYKLYPFHFEQTDSIKILFLGGFPNYSGPNDDLKGGYTLINVIKQLNNEKLHNKLIFEIGGPKSFECIDKLKEINNENIEIDVIGEIDEETVKTRMQNSHMIIIPSRMEGLPNVLWEGMATGNLVIASAVGGIPEILSINNCGILVEAGNYLSIAETIKYFSSNQNEIEDYAIRAYNVVKRFNYQNFINDNLCVLKKIT